MSNFYYLYKPEKGEFFDLGTKVPWVFDIFGYERTFVIGDHFRDLQDFADSIYLAFVRCAEQTEDQYRVWCEAVARNVWGWAGADAFKFLMDEMDANWTVEKWLEKKPITGTWLDGVKWP